MTRPIALATVLALLVGCSERRVVIHYVIPNGYRGPLKIVGDGDDSNGYAFEAGQHVYRFPQSAVLHVKTTWPFENWHSLTAEYANGTTIYSLWHSAPNSDAIRVEGLGFSTGHTGPGAFWDVVGNEREVRRSQKAWNENGSDTLEGRLGKN